MENNNKHEIVIEFCKQVNECYPDLKLIAYYTEEKEYCIYHDYAKRFSDDSFCENVGHLIREYLYKKDTYEVGVTYSSDIEEEKEFYSDYGDILETEVIYNTF